MDHRYDYEVVGQGFPLHTRINTTVNNTSYGLFRVRIIDTAMAAAAVPPGGEVTFESFMVGTRGNGGDFGAGAFPSIGLGVDDGIHVVHRIIEDRRIGIGEATAAVGRAIVMTTATTFLALLPIITSPGRGADIMLPMAVPSVGGMCVAMLTVFVVPVVYAAIEELRLRRLAGQHEVGAESLPQPV